MDVGSVPSTKTGVLGGDMQVRHGMYGRFGHLRRQGTDKVKIEKSAEGSLCTGVLNNSSGFCAQAYGK